MRNPLLRQHALATLLLLVSALVPTAAPAANTGFGDDRCLGCHLAKTARSHPVGIAPPVDDPRLVLTADGHIGCVTCHFSHGPSPTRLGARNRRQRVKCAVCHGNSAGHTRLPFLAHELVDTAGGQVTLKRQTRACLACHDGASGPDTHVYDGTGTATRTRTIYVSGGEPPQIGRSHPILVDYERIAGARPRDYRSPDEMSSIIQFEDGELGCLSCHDLFGVSGEGHLVQSNFRSALCLQCHRMSPGTNEDGAPTRLLDLARAGVLRPYRGEPIDLGR